MYQGLAVPTQVCGPRLFSLFAWVWNHLRDTPGRTAVRVLQGGLRDDFPECGEHRHPSPSSCLEGVHCLTPFLLLCLPRSDELTVFPQTQTLPFDVFCQVFPKEQQDKLLLQVLCKQIQISINSREITEEGRAHLFIEHLLHTSSKDIKKAQTHLIPTLTASRITI